MTNSVDAYELTKYLVFGARRSHARLDNLGVNVDGIQNSLSLVGWQELLFQS
jgi:hypothetical protein